MAATQVTVMATLAGDTNLDGSVDGTDLFNLLGSYGTAGVWASGDTDYSGSIDGSDLFNLLAKYGGNVGGTVNGGNLDAQAIQLLSDAGFHVVPEPSSLILLAIAALMGLGVIGRRRSTIGGVLKNSIFHRRCRMTRVLMLSACVVLGGVLAARAETLTNESGDSVTIGFTRTALSGDLTGVDQIDFMVDAITGTAKVNGLAATMAQDPGRACAVFTVSGGVGTPYILVDTGDPADNKGTDAPGSFVNFDSTVLDGPAGTILSSSLVPAGYEGWISAQSSFVDTWSTTKASVRLGAGGLLASIYVNTGADVSCTGLVGIYGGTGTSIAGTFSTITTPEPGTLALLATGLMGLLAYAWRKRK